MQEQAELLREFMEQSRLSQAQIAEKAGVSQATVSRALSGSARRQGAAKARLFIYAGIGEYPAQAKASNARTKALAAFEHILRKSEAYAETIAIALEALAEFEPGKQRSDPE